MANNPGTAYFVGGPMDLTKQRLADIVPRIYFPELDRDYKAFLDIQAIRPEEAVICTNHVYVAEWVSNDRDGKKIVFYFYQGRQ